MSTWKKDPSFLHRELTKELVLEVGGDDFREAAEIYARFGKSK
jgi:hypothetical protein